MMMMMMMMIDISGGPCRDHNYVLEQIHLHWGEDDGEGSEHLINANGFAAEVGLSKFY